MLPRKSNPKANKPAKLESLEAQLQQVQGTWLGMDHKKLQIARKGGLLVAQIKGALKKEGKEFSSWCDEKEEAGVIKVGQRTLQKWMRVNKKWDGIVARAQQDGLDPEELGLDKALAYAAKQKTSRTGPHPSGGNGGVDNKPKNKLKLTCEVSGLVLTDLERAEFQRLLNDGQATLKLNLKVVDKGGRRLLEVVEVECAPQVRVEDVVGVERATEVCVEDVVE